MAQQSGMRAQLDDRAFADHGDAVGVAGTSAAGGEKGGDSAAHLGAVVVSVGYLMPSCSR